MHFYINIDINQYHFVTHNFGLNYTIKRGESQPSNLSKNKFLYCEKKVKLWKVGKFDG